MCSLRVNSCGSNLDLKVSKVSRMDDNTGAGVNGLDVGPSMFGADDNTFNINNNTLIVTPKRTHW